MGLVVNTVIRNVVCLFCKVSFQWDGVANHLASAPVHSGHHVRIDWDKYMDVMEEMGVQESLPEPYVTAAEEIQGLKVQDGIRCTFCPKPFRTVRSMQEHHRKIHKGSAMPSEWPSCKMQQFNNGNACTLWEMIPRTLPSEHPPSDDEAIISEFIARSEVEIPYAVPEDDREVSPWLLSTRWHLHVAPYDVRELRSLAALPDRDEFPGLGAAVLAYFRAATDLVGHTLDLPLQILNSEDPVKQ
jgi:hypothetical protein